MRPGLESVTDPSSSHFAPGDEHLPKPPSVTDAARQLQCASGVRFLNEVSDGCKDSTQPGAAVAGDLADPVRSRRAGGARPSGAIDGDPGIHCGRADPGGTVSARAHRAPRRSAVDYS